MKTETQTSRGRRTIVTWIRRASIGLLVPAVMAAGGYSLLQSQAGQKWAGGLAARVLSDADIGSVGILRLELDSWKRLRLHDVSVTDRDGTWVKAPEIVVDWLPMALLRGEITVEAVTLPRIDVLRRPVTDTPASTEPGPLLPRMPRGLRTVSIDTFALHPSVIGIGAMFRVRYHGLSEGQASNGMSLAVERLDRATDRVELVARTDIANDRLTLRARGREGPDGVIARFLGLPSNSRLSLDLEGEGRLQDWNGKLNARSGESMLIDAAIGLRVRSRSDISVVAKGEIGSATLSALALPPPLRSPVRFDADVGWREAKNRIRIERLNLDHAFGRLDLNGNVIADDALVDVDISASIRGGDWIASLAGREVRLDAAKIDGKVTGPVSAPTAKAQATLSGAATPEVTVGTARLVASLEGTRTTSRRLRADLDLAELAFHSPVAATLFGDSATLSTRADVDPTLARLTGLEASLRSGAVALAVSDGTIDRGRESATLTLEATVANLGRIGKASALAIDGEAKLRGQVSIERGTVGATVSINGERLRFGEPALDSIIGPRPTIEAMIGRSPENAITVRDVRLNAATFRIGGSASLGPGNDRLTSKLVVTADDLSQVTSAFGTAIGGQATMSVIADGRLSDPDVAASLRISALRVAQRALGSLEVEAKATTVISRPAGQMSARFQPPEGRIDLTLGFASVRPATLRLHDIALRGLGGEGGGSLDVFLDRGVAVGKLLMAFPDLAKLSQVAGRSLGGAVSAEAALGSDAGRQTVKIRASGERLVTGDDIAAGSVTCKGEIQGLATDARVDASCSVADFRMNDWRATRAAIVVGGTVSRASARLDVSGERPVVHRLDAKVAFEQHDGRVVVRFEEFGGEVGDQPVLLLEPFRIGLAPDTVELGKARIRLGRAELAIVGSLANGTVSGDAQLTGAELSDYATIMRRPNVSGRVDGTMSLRGDSTHPEVRFAARISQLVLTPEARESGPRIEGTITGRIADGTLSVETTLSGFAKTGLRANGDVPVAFSLSPPVLRLVDDAPVRADAAWEGELGPLVELFPIPGHSISGQASVSLLVTGTIRRPIAKGSFTLRKGRYENLFTGMVLTGVTVDGDGDDDRVRIRFAAGGEGGTDRVDGSGSVLLDRDRGYPLDLAVSLTQLAAVRRDDLSVVLDGRLALAGGLDDLLLRGEIETRRVEWRIGQPLPPGVVDVDVTEIGGKTEMKSPSEHRASARQRDLRLQLDIRMPGNVYVRGRGLDSEWRGALEISGRASSPSVTGKLEHVRGQFEFAGKIFKIARGVVSFSRDDEIDPDIDIRAEHLAKSFTANVTVSGKASRPAIALSSAPPMPRDEILSRILFGKGVGQLSPLEAAQLAVAVASVTGLDGGSAGLIDTLRRTVGVDVLRLGADSKGSPTAVVGKNISDELYVGVEQGAAQQSGKVQVELEILPGVKLTSGVTAETQGNIGIEFRWDY